MEYQILSRESRFGHWWAEVVSAGVRVYETPNYGTSDEAVADAERWAWEQMTAGVHRQYEGNRS